MPAGSPIDDLSWADLEPLFQETWQGTDGAWQVLHPLLPAVGRVCQGLMRRRRPTSRFPTPEELLQAVLVLSVRRLTHSAGMRPPTDRSSKTPRGFFLNYIKTCALDCLKPVKSDDERPVKALAGRSEPPERQLDRLATTSDLAVHAASPDHRLDAQRSLQAVRTVVDGPEVNPRHRVVWICLRVPEWLEPHHVTQAVQASSGSDGIVRPASALLELLEQWRAQVVDPSSRRSRKQLAWMFFSTSPPPAEDWATHHPHDARRARDRLRQWDARFHRAHLLPLQPPPQARP